MKAVIVDTIWQKFLPLTYTKPIGHLRIGIDRIFEKWASYLEMEVTCVSESYLSAKFFEPFVGATLIINSNILPSKALLKAVLELPMNAMLVHQKDWLVVKSELGFENTDWKNLSPIQFNSAVVKLNHWSDLFLKNGEVLEQDFERFTMGRTSAKLSDSNTVVGDPNLIFLEEGATVEGATLSTRFGPIYIGKNADIMEGAIIRGPFAALEGAMIKLGAKIYGPTTIGPKCRAGGEIKNSIFQGFSNKSHDGYLGNSVVGEWVNLGADTNCSNLKNTFSPVKVWDYSNDDYIQSSLNYLGCVIGDYSKTGINSMLNTASTIGVNVNWFGAGFPEKFIPSFSWGNDQEYDLGKAWEINQNIAEMAGEELSVLDRDILTEVFLRTKKYRKK